MRIQGAREDGPGFCFLIHEMAYLKMMVWGLNEEDEGKSPAPGVP